MNSRAFVDFILIMVVYLVCAGLIYAAVAFEWPAAMGVQLGNDTETNQPMRPERFGELYQTWLAVVGGVSLLCAFAWYTLGEWGPKANRISSGTWLAIWFALFVAVALGGVAAILLGPQVSENSWVLTVSYMLAGPVFYFLATMLFSPANTKYIVPASGFIRRAW
jgi:hypothetical protein